MGALVFMLRLIDNIKTLQSTVLLCVYSTQKFHGCSHASYTSVWELELDFVLLDQNLIVYVKFFLHAPLAI